MSQNFQTRGSTGNGTTEENSALSLLVHAADARHNIPPNPFANPKPLNGQTRQNPKKRPTRPELDTNFGQSPLQEKIQDLGIGASFSRLNNTARTETQAPMIPRPGATAPHDDGRPSAASHHHQRHLQQLRLGGGPGGANGHGDPEGLYNNSALMTALSSQQQQQHEAAALSLVSNIRAAAAAEQFRQAAQLQHLNQPSPNFLNQDLLFARAAAAAAAQPGGLGGSATSAGGLGAASLLDLQLQQQQHQQQLQKELELQLIQAQEFELQRLQRAAAAQAQQQQGVEMLRQELLERQLKQHQQSPLSVTENNVTQTPNFASGQQRENLIGGAPGAPAPPPNVPEPQLPSNGQGSGPCPPSNGQVQGKASSSSSRVPKEEEEGDVCKNVTAPGGLPKDTFKKTPGSVVVPCRARGMPMDHNFKTAYFVIPENAEHGEELICSYFACRNAGIKFRYCIQCKVPVAKRNFRKRHKHGMTDLGSDDEGGNGKDQDSDDGESLVSSHSPPVKQETMSRSTPPSPAPPPSSHPSLQPPPNARKSSGGPSPLVGPRVPEASSLQQWKGTEIRNKFEGGANPSAPAPGHQPSLALRGKPPSNIPTVPPVTTVKAPAPISHPRLKSPSPQAMQDRQRVPEHSPSENREEIVSSDGRIPSDTLVCLPTSDDSRVKNRDPRIDDKRAERWASLLSERPSTGDSNAMSAWLLEVLAISDLEKPLKEDGSNNVPGPAPPSHPTTVAQPNPSRQPQSSACATFNNVPSTRHISGNSRTGLANGSAHSSTTLPSFASLKYKKRDHASAAIEGTNGTVMVGGERKKSKTNLVYGK